MVALLAIACTPNPEPEASNPFLNVRDGVAYVGNAACASCHEDISQRYPSHGMAQSLAAVEAANPPAPLDTTAIYHAGSDLWYRVIQADGQLWQEETRHDDTVSVTHRLRRPMTLTVGSGNGGFSFFGEQNGRYYQLPLAWYRDAETWDLGLGYDTNNRRFDRQMDARCVSCHASYPKAEAAPRVFEGDLTPIGCERCHGPGALHVEARLADEDGGGIDYTIVNPAHLPLERRLDVCQQCHLNGDVALLREGRSDFGFRPSEVLDDHIAFFNVAREASAQIEVVSHAERMTASACFIESATTQAPMDCATCHDPHEGFRDKGPAYFNTTCQTCHTPTALMPTLSATAQATHTPDANCVACHMPKTGIFDTPHAAFTDHHIRVVDEATPTEQATEAEVVALVAYFERDQDGAEARLYTALAHIAEAERTGDAVALREAAQQATAFLKRRAHRYPDAVHQTAQAWQFLGEPNAALDLLDRANASADPKHHLLRAQLLAQTGADTDRIANLYQQALSAQPQWLEARLQFAEWLRLTGQLDAAQTAYTTAQAQAPWETAPIYGLGLVARDRQQFEAAREAFETVLALNPDHADAFYSLGTLDAQAGRLRSARRFFTEALDRNPQHVGALYNLGVFALQQRAWSDGARYLERATAAAPDYAAAHLQLGLAYLNLNRLSEAAAAAETVLQLRPGDPQAQRVLAAATR
ncbi:MAG: hypothetical protein RhofKO_16950 [Rhodothermales bacterium]